jgi:anti-anti-sigma regulatory factor
MMAPAIKHFAEGVLDGGEVKGWMFDLTEAELLDSTNLGLLARIAERVHRSGGARCVIVSTREDINCVLQSMAFDEVFELVTAPQSGGRRDRGRTFVSQGAG